MTSLSTSYDEDFNATYIYKQSNIYINNIYIYTIEHKNISEHENSISEHENSTSENISKNSEIWKFENISENLDIKFSEQNTNDNTTNRLIFFIYMFALFCHGYYFIKILIEYYVLT